MPDIHDVTTHHNITYSLELVYDCIEWVELRVIFFYIFISTFGWNQHNDNNDNNDNNNDDNDNNDYDSDSDNDSDNDNHSDNDNDQGYDYDGDPMIIENIFVSAAKCRRMRQLNMPPWRVAWPLSEPILHYYQFDANEHTSLTF